ncbi:autotransporter assembly complex protein TamA [Oceanicella actignis]|uniref:autotransporter assembly complex protein TamA n=1 Tax=Oceanicella actignis TaxID=1189325 RepID=UPI0011E66A06|nr:BamA/TamA family outer membrane protein [Oceanicella actignis]TYO85410.1 autotransporter secretion outer membrane protein TamA [Oceanicella actignis]
MSSSLRRSCVAACVMAALAGALPGCAWLGGDAAPGLAPAAEAFEAPRTQVRYEVELRGAPDDDVAALLEQSLALYRFQDEGAQSVAFLRRRAEQDAELARKILRSRGYYEGKLAFRILRGEKAASGAAPAPAADPFAREPAAPAEAGPAHEAAPQPAPDAAERVRVRLRVKPGRPFILAEHRFVVVDHGQGAAPVPPDAAALGSPVGRRALAARILGAEQAAVAALRRDGRPFARIEGRRAVADMQAARLEVETILSAGPEQRFGPVRFEGLSQVREDYLLSYLPWREGEPVDADKLAEFQKRLASTNLFSTVVVRLPDGPAPDGAAPVIVAAEEGPPRTVAAELNLSTARGPELAASFVHRNLWGANERLGAELDLGFALQALSVELRKPQFRRAGQELALGASARHESDDAFEQSALTLTAGVQRALDPSLTVGLGGLAEVSEIDDGARQEDAFLLGAPAFARYEGADDLINPTQGWRAELKAAPFAGLVGGRAAPFLVADARGAVYFPLDAGGRTVLAAHGRAAAILSESLGDVPAPRRLYAGGGGSVRGYRERFVGPLDSAGDPIGGRSALELGAELRWRVRGDLGAAAFVDAGSVSTSVFPDFAEGVQLAAGLGARYYSPVGPLRLDVAAPLNPRDADDAFQIYFSIGQAF